MKYLILTILMALAAFALPVLYKHAPATAKNKAAIFIDGLREQFRVPNIQRMVQAANDTYDAAVETHECSVRRTNDVAVATRHLLWAQGAGANTVKLATATLPALGTIDNTETATDKGQSVLLLGRGPTKKMVASEAITVGTHLAVFQASGGKVATSGTIYVGVPLTSTSADGDILEIDDTCAIPKGHVTGSGGVVTQITSSSTGVTLNKPTGQITTVALTTAAAAEEVFTVSNSLVAATDVPVLATTYAGAGTPALSVKNVVAGAFDIVITNLHASAALNAAMTINFSLIKAVAA